MRRSYLNINAGSLLEVAAAIVGACGVYRLAGIGWALVACFVLLVAMAEWVFPTSTWRVPLPNRPHPRTKLKGHRQALRLRWYRLKYRWLDRRSA